MEFTTMFKHHPRKGENFSKRLIPSYKVNINKKTGERELVVDKEIDVYEKIQEYRDEVQISNILKRYDLDMLKQLKDDEQQLIDLTNMPENLMETMAVIDSAKYAWERQSKELKAKFDNDFNKFIASSENGQLATMLNSELKTQVEKFAPHVQADMPASVVTPTSGVQPTTSVSNVTSELKGDNSNV